MKVLIDTNIVIDSIASRTPHDVVAQDIFLLAARKKVNAAITASTVSDIYYLTKKRLHSNQQATDVLKKLFDIFDVVTVDKNDCLKALETGMDDYEDSLLAVCAVRYKAAYIVTRNKKGFLQSPVPSVLPQEFINMVN